MDLKKLNIRKYHILFQRYCSQKVKTLNSDSVAKSKSINENELDIIEGKI